ncbi:ATP synthase F1 subunit gamma [Metamycoplasma subdolum]|uniref:ATP synthase F1 subunit gamma n=1 Tax=Metamycoplasma subdolum TaxID=92407 RepID=UPI00298C13EF|nr:ATP synthase F1 subunit gamma [Metamycoplasma subdolum]WPB50644.1 ATP synthase F1 subunit gamma [Metamycoplasma subdolum]
MKSLQKIKHRINSINSTKKITKAMQLVATAKYGKIKNKLEDVSLYYKTVQNVFFNLMKNSTQDIDTLLNVKAYKFEKSRNLYIIVGSDLGLCGSYNSNLIKKINEEVKGKDILIVIGSKILSIINKNPNFHIIQTLTQIGDNPSYEIAQIISQKIYDVLEISWLKSVKIIYTKYINAIKSEPIVEEIFPVTFSKEKEEIITDEKDKQTYEPSAEKILTTSFTLFFEASIYNALFNSKLAETSSRRTAMEQASDNAEDLIEELEHEYNNSRQSKITQEITEIVSGANK